MRKWQTKTKEHTGGSISSWLSNPSPQQSFKKSWDSKRSPGEFEPFNSEPKGRFSSRKDEPPATAVVDDAALLEQLERVKQTSVSLSAGQNRVLDLIIKRKSVFFTGAAGNYCKLHAL